MIVNWRCYLSFAAEIHQGSNYDIVVFAMKSFFKEKIVTMWQWFSKLHNPCFLSKKALSFKNVGHSLKYQKLIFGESQLVNKNDQDKMFVQFRVLLLFWWLIQNDQLISLSLSLFLTHTHTHTQSCKMKTFSYWTFNYVFQQW